MTPTPRAVLRRGGLLPVDTSRFESDYAVTTDPDGVPDASDGATWGFSLTLE